MNCIYSMASDTEHCKMDNYLWEPSQLTKPIIVTYLSWVPARRPTLFSSRGICSESSWRSGEPTPSPRSPRAPRCPTPLAKHHLEEEKRKREELFWIKVSVSSYKIIRFVVTVSFNKQPRDQLPIICSLWGARQWWKVSNSYVTHLPRYGNIELRISSEFQGFYPLQVAVTPKHWNLWKCNAHWWWDPKSNICQYYCSVTVPE